MITVLLPVESAVCLEPAIQPLHLKDSVLYFGISILVVGATPLKQQFGVVVIRGRPKISRDDKGLFLDF